MELNAVRMLADWLAGPTTGVAALLASTPRDAGDPTPGLADVYDATRDGWVARREVPREGGPQLPGLAVFANPLTLDGEVHTSVRDAQIELVIAYVARASDSAAATTAGLYVRRAVLRSLALFNANANAAARLRNNIALYACDSLHLGSLMDQWGDAVVTDAVKATYHVRDLAP